MDLNEDSAWDEESAPEDLDESCNPAEDTDAQTNAFKKELFSWAATFAIAFALVFFLKNYVIINATVPTGSMENTIMPADRMFGNRLAYLFSEPKRGDVIFFYYPDDESQKFVKRVIGLPGETVTIVNACIYIDGVLLDEPYLKETWVIDAGPYEFKVPEGCYLVLGDNRNTSRDARFWKNTYVKKEKIIGKAGLIYYPLDRIGVVE